MTPVELVRDGAAQSRRPDVRADVRTDGRTEVTVRRAGPRDVAGIAALVAAWAADGLLLPRTEGQIARALDDYVVAADARGRVLACAALREYSPSLAELVSVAVDRRAHGLGLGRRVVAAVERLAAVRGHATLFAHTLQPEFFAAVGYEAVDRAGYPEKAARPHTCCFRRALDAADPVPFAAAA